MNITEHITQRERVKVEDVGVYLKLIQMDYQCDSDDQLATLISEQFNVDCREQDIQAYENLYKLKEFEDYEKLSRMAEYGNVEYRIE